MWRAPSEVAVASGLPQLSPFSFLLCPTARDITGLAAEAVEFVIDDVLFLDLDPINLRRRSLSPDFFP